jgi:hypothetical protein
MPDSKTTIPKTILRMMIPVSKQKSQQQLRQLPLLHHLPVNVENDGDLGASSRHHNHHHPQPWRIKQPWRIQL